MFNSMFIVICSPAGVFEFDKFATGTKSLMDAVVAVTSKGAVSIIGKWLRKLDGDLGPASKQPFFLL